MIPPEAFTSLLLETKDATRGLGEAEDYLTTRKQNAAHPNISTFRHFGHKHSFAVRLFDSGSLYQTMYQQSCIRQCIRRLRNEQIRGRRIRSWSLRGRRCSTIVFPSTCGTLYVQNPPLGEHDPNKCSEIEKRADQGEKDKKLELERQKIQYDHLAQRCSTIVLPKSLKNRRITVFELPLPDDENQAKAIVVEIAIPTIV
ncbi:hypothetical protein B0T24DRAFT_124144 [Lasiosphaeria ovina]|uniref:Uncharacterized protein n=1 Tax=Lasiosphaeria ovina TaxID=92902 RepID=A0AAE0JTL8_9PEZI|nr:hypothetical protein B0T24DRAFT_124144 [Lasiosphaeria ovina]